MHHISFTERTPLGPNETPRMPTRRRITDEGNYLPAAPAPKSFLMRCLLLFRSRLFSQLRLVRLEFAQLLLEFFLSVQTKWRKIAILNWAATLFAS